MLIMTQRTKAEQIKSESEKRNKDRKLRSRVTSNVLSERWEQKKKLSRETTERMRKTFPFENVKVKIVLCSKLAKKR